MCKAPLNPAGLVWILRDDPVINVDPKTVSQLFSQAALPQEEAEESAACRLVWHPDLCQPADLESTRSRVRRVRTLGYTVVPTHTQRHLAVPKCSFA